MTNSRRKGAAYERELAAAFGDSLGSAFTRRLGQARDSGHDLDIGPLVVEAKRRASLTTVTKWMQQAVTAAARRHKAQGGTEADHLPAVVCRQDGDKTSYVIMRLQDFLTLVGDTLREHLSRKD